MAYKGKLIVIDGTDGSGKATHTDMLMERLAREGRGNLIKKTDFPQYKTYSAFFVEKYLRGEYGALDEVGPSRASLFYALDRYDASFEIRQWLEEGVTIISNRYASSNIGHQAGKITDPEERDRCIAWIKEIEYELLGIPKPDINILLYVPPKMGQRLVGMKQKREYARGKKRDIHEADLGHLKKASDAYLYVAEKEGWKVINCMDKRAKLRGKEDIHQEIWDYLKEREAI